MLFRSLIDRLLGSLGGSPENLELSGNRPNISYEDHPGLLDLTLRLLHATQTSGTEQSQTGMRSEKFEMIFPFLDLIGKAPPPRLHFHDIRRMVFQTLSSHSWHIRDIAARTLATSLTFPTPGLHVQSLSDSCFTRPCNEVHGRLLSVKYSLVIMPLFEDAKLTRGIS